MAPHTNMPVCNRACYMLLCLPYMPESQCGPWWKLIRKGSVGILHMCPHTAMYVSSYCYVCVLILLHVCPHTAMYVSSYCYVCVLIQLRICPHTTMYVPSYCNVCVLIQLCMCGHTTMYVPSYCNACVLIQIYMCPLPALCVSSCCHVCISCPHAAMCVLKPHHATHSARELVGQRVQLQYRSPARVIS